MAVPKKKIARSKGKVRTSAYDAKQIQKLTNRARGEKCDNCGEIKLQKTVCTACGFYRGKKIISKKGKRVTKIKA
jgi:large subunit ribosomal protein L32